MKLEDVIKIWNQNNQNFIEASRDLAALLLPREEQSFCCPALGDWGQNRDDCKGLLESLQSECSSLLESLQTRSQLRLESVLNFSQISTQNRSTVLRELLKKYRSCYFDHLWTAANSSKKSAAWIRLKTSDNSDHRALAETIEELVSKIDISYQHPGVAMLLDTLLELCGERLDRPSTPPKTGNQWCPGHIWILTAMKHVDSGAPPGLLLRLRIEKIPNGCGAIYPHPRFAAHVGFTESFAAGIRNAWAIVKNGDAAFEDSDYRWWMTVVEPPVNRTEHEHDLREPLSQWMVRFELDGESATLAFAVALKSVVKGELLRRDRATTACFRDTGAYDDTFGWGYVQNATNPQLFPVGSISNKEQAIQLCTQKGVGIGGLVLQSQQKSMFPNEIPVIPAATFDDAYREFSVMERLLNGFAEERAVRWQSLVKLGKESAIDGST